MMKKVIKRVSRDSGIASRNLADFETRRRRSKSEVNLSRKKGLLSCAWWKMFLPNPATGMRFLSRREPPRTSVTQSPILNPLFLLPFSFLLLGSTANALPGETTDTVTAWINAHPTLRPGIGDGLLVQKTSTPAQRFSFQATVLPPGRVSLPRDRGTIRTERLSFYDMVNGVTPERLEESLRTIYGSTIYQDFDRASIVYYYPTPEIAELARRQNRPLLAARQGELRLGERFAYWWEITQTEEGKAFNGQLTVFLKEDFDKLETELRDR